MSRPRRNVVPLVLAEGAIASVLDVDSGRSLPNGIAKVLLKFLVASFGHGRLSLRFND